MVSLKQREDPNYESTLDFYDRVRQLASGVINNPEMKQEDMSVRENLLMDNFVKVIFVSGLRPAIGRMMTTTDETSTLEQVVMAADWIEKTEQSYGEGPAAEASAVNAYPYFRGRGYRQNQQLTRVYSYGNQPQNQMQFGRGRGRRMDGQQGPCGRGRGRATSRGGPRFVNMPQRMRPQIRCWRCNLLGQHYAFNCTFPPAQFVNEVEKFEDFPN